MDILRGAAILAVISFHSVTIVEQYDFEAPKLWRNLNETLKLFRMPILIFLSGMLLPRSLSKSSLNYFSGKVRSILWPFILWSTIYAVVKGIDLTSLSQLGGLYMGGSYLWFLAFIFVYYLVAKPLERVDPFLVSIVAFVLALIAPDGDKYSERILFLMSLFFLGSAVSYHLVYIKKILDSSLIWWLTPFVAVSAFVTVRDDLNFGPFWVLVSLFGFLFFAAISQRLESSAISRPLVWIGQRSIVFYVSHAIFIIVICKISERAGFTSYAFVAAASAMISLSGGWVLAKGMERWAAFRYLFTFPVLNFSDFSGSPGRK